ncbi:hypothetical protein D3C72_1019270 [compost metagenome]
MLHRLIQILFGEESRVVRRNGPYQTRQGGLFRRLGIFHPVQQGFRRFCRLLVAGGSIANHQHVGLHLLAIMFQQPCAFGLCKRREIGLRWRGNINNIDVIQHTVFSGQDQFACQECQHVDGNANGIQHLAIIQRVQHGFLCVRRGELCASEEPFAGQAEIIDQQTQRCRQLAGVAGLMQHVGQFQPLLGQFLLLTPQQRPDAGASA